MPFDMARGKIHDGEQGGSWELGLEAVSWSERHEQMGKGRENHGKNITERCEEQDVLFGMSQGAATKRWTFAGGQCRGMGHELPVSWLLVVVDLCFHCLISLYLGSKPKSKQCASCF